MGLIEASMDRLYLQASETAAGFLRKAIVEIDAALGEGVAAKNPALVAAFMGVASRDFQTGAVLKVLENIVAEARGS